MFDKNVKKFLDDITETLVKLKGCHKNIKKV